MPVPTEHAPIVWLGNPFYHGHLPACGYPVIYQPFDTTQPMYWNDILNITGGETPIAVVVGDASVPPILLGLEHFPCLTIFQSVDAHIHLWQPLFGQAFDFCFVNLKDCIPSFQQGFLPPERVHWTPPYYPDQFIPEVPGWQSPKEWDLLFIGTVDPELTPGRFAFFQKIKEQVPFFHIINRAHWPELYPKARVVLNECALGDFNFRVIETMGTGTCLLTPMIGHGLTELFTPGKDLVTYNQNDIIGCVQTIKKLIADDHLTQHVGKNGQKLVLQSHLASHRAMHMASLLSSLCKSGDYARIVANRLGQAHTIHESALKLLYLHHAETVGHPTLQSAYLEAARGIYT